MKALMLFVGIFLIFLLACSSQYQFTSQGQILKNELPQMTDIERVELMEKTPYQTPVFFFRSEQPGPAIIILGGTHGNEPAGYESALRLIERFRESPLKKGIIILIPLANRLAVENYNRRVPVPEGVDREKGNLNRCYPGNPEGYPMEQMAYQIQQLAMENQVEVFIDLHEARRLHLEDDPEGEEKSLGQTIIYYPNEASTWLLMQMLDHINSQISDPDKQFSSLERPIKNSAAWWAGNYLNIAAFTFETPRSLPIEERIGYHLALVEVVLNDRGM